MTYQVGANDPVRQEAVYQTELEGLELVSRGKVRDIYRVDEEHLLFVATDRLSAFDVVLPDPIPGKGAVLTQLSNFWFGRTTHLVPNHLSPLPLEEVVRSREDRELLRERAVVVKTLTPLPIEAIVRGYIIGSGWRDYERTGVVCGIELAPGLKQAQQLPEPIFTPSTKAEVGDHDENISFDAAVARVGSDIAERVRDLSIQIYQEAASYAAQRGIIVADTKFEFGLDGAGDLVLIDEVVTPDSSRFWPASEYQVGISPPSFDKQYLRDHLEALGWDKKAPAPRLSPEVIEQTASKYQEAYRRLVNPNQS